MTPVQLAKDIAELVSEFERTTGGQVMTIVITESDDPDGLLPAGMERVHSVTISVREAGSVN